MKPALRQRLERRSKVSASLSPGSQKPFKHRVYDGTKYPGGLEGPGILWTDYWALRKRSEELFKENIYARGIVRRFVTNVINTGLTPENTPSETTLSPDSNRLREFSRLLETYFSLWCSDERLCDYREMMPFGLLQQTAYLEALINGDVLAVMDQGKVRLISGDAVRTPYLMAAQSENDIIEGVEVDKRGRHVAFYVQQDDLTFKRIPAYGRRSKKRQAWLVYATERRINDTRGEPLLGILIQSLKELDRYRDAALRKAVVNSILAMFIKKTEQQFASLAMAQAAVRKSKQTIEDPDASQKRSFEITQHVPGVVLEELQVGEEPVAFNNDGTDTKLGEFEESIVQAMAWALEVPPEILRLSFSSNYSASTAAVNEYKLFLEKVWRNWGWGFCTPIFEDWFLRNAESGLFSTVQAIVDLVVQAWVSGDRIHFKAFVRTEWYGAAKPSVDIYKQAKASQILVNECWSTNHREARGISGMKFEDVAKRVEEENKLKAAALRPILELMAEFGEDQVNKAMAGNRSVSARPERNDEGSGTDDDDS